MSNIYLVRVYTGSIRLLLEEKAFRSADKAEAYSESIKNREGLKAYDISISTIEFEE